MLEAAKRWYRKMNRQLKVVFWFTIAGFLQRGIGIITTPIFTRVMTTDDYGMFSVFGAYDSVIAIVVTLNLHMGGIHNAFVKNPAENKKIVSVFQSLALTLSLGFLLFAFLFRRELSSLMGLPVAATMAMFLGFVFKEPYHLWMIEKRYQYEYVRPVAVSLAISLCAPLAGVAAILLFPERQGEARILAYTAVGVVAPGAFFYAANYRRGKCFYDKELWSYALTFNIPLVAHYLSESLLNQTDRIMINAYLGTGDAGIYSVAYSAASLAMIFSSALNTAFVPWTYQKLKEKDYRAIERAGYAVLTFLACVLSGMILLAPEVVSILAGSRYTGAVFLIPTLGASVFFSYMYQLFSRIELYYEKKRYAVIATATAAGLNIALNALWIPRFGFVAAGYSTLLSHVLFCVMHYFFFRKINRECMASARVYDWKKLAAIAAAELALTFAATLLYRCQALRLGIVAATALAALLGRRRIVGIFKRRFGSGEEKTAEALPCSEPEKERTGREPAQ